MVKYAWQALNQLQIFDVLRGAELCRLAVEEDGQPWCVPMRFQFEVSGTETVIHLTMPDHGRKLEAMSRNDRVCLEFELPGCAWTDTLIITGRVSVGMYVPGQAMHLRVRAREMSGRRFYMEEE